MNRSKNIFIKVTLLITCLLGWSGSVWGQSSPTYSGWQGSDFTSLGTYDMNQAVLFMQQQFTPTASGNMSVSLQWNNGNKRIDVYGIDLLDNAGNVVTSDYRWLWTGGGRQIITYNLTGLTAGTTYTMRAYTGVNDDSNGPFVTNTGNTCVGAITYSGAASAGLSLKTDWNLARDRASWVVDNNAPSAVLENARARGWKRYSNMQTHDEANVSLSKGQTFVMTLTGTTGTLNVKGVELLDANNKVVSSDIHDCAVTSSNTGSYGFTAPAAGTYKVRLLAQSNSAISSTGTITYASPEKWTVNINGGYKVVYNGASYGNNEKVTIDINTHDYRGITVNAPSTKAVWGPLIDNASKTITFEISDPAIPQAGKWYKVQVLPTPGNLNNTNILPVINDRILPQGVKGEYIYLQNAKDPSLRSDYKAIHCFMGMPENEAEAYIYVNYFTNNNILLQHVNGRYINNEGKQQTTAPGSSDVLLTRETTGNFVGSYYWNKLQPFSLNAGDIAHYFGRSSNSTNNFHTYFTEVNPTEKFDVYRIAIQGANDNSQVTYNGTGSKGFSTVYNGGYLFLEKETAINKGDFSLTNVAFQNPEISVSEPDASGIRTLSFKMSLSLTQPKWYYIQNYNGNYYLSTGSDYLLSDGGLALSNTTKPSDYQGLWMEIPTGTFDADGNGVMYFVNAYSGDTKVLALTGADGNAKAKMYTLDELPASAKVFFERRHYTGHNGSFYYREPNTNNYLNNRSEGGRHLAFWNSDRAYGENGSRFAHSEVANLPDNITIHYEAEQAGIDIPSDLTILYESLERYRMVDGTATQIPGSTHVLTDNMPFNFGNVPFISSLFTSSNKEFPLKNVRVEGNNVYFIIGQLPRILHRQSHLFDKLANTPDDQLPRQGFIQKGQGMTTNPFTAEPIQYISNYNITQYIKHGQGKQLFMPTIDGNNSEVTAYQRWYDYKEESRPNSDVINIPGYVAAAGEYLNGFVVGSNNSRGSIIKNATANLPSHLSEYWLAVDQSRYNDGRNESNGDLVEPSLTMRVIYHLIDAKVMADSMKNCSLGSGNWIETHNISYPNRKLWNGSNDTKSGVDYIGLNLEFSNYWCYDGEGTADGNLEQMTDGKLIVVLDGESTADLRNVKILANGDAGIGNVQGFSRNRFIAFQYPRTTDGKYEVPVGSKAYINVYMQNDAGTRFQLARINLSFISDAEPLLLNEVYGKNEDGSFKSARSAEAMKATYGNPISELTFDHKEYLPFNCPNGTNNEAYAFALDFKQSSYAYHGAPWASRGEYIFRNGGAAIGGKTFYPIESLKNAIDNNSNTLSKVTGKYFLYIDASEQPGQVMSIPIPERLCVGSRMFCYGWFNSATQIGQQSVGIVINIVGKRNVNDTEGEIIYSYNPGLLSTKAFNSDDQVVEYIKNAAPWRQVGFSFTIDSKAAGRYAAYEMQVMNNCYSTNGGDYTLDNFYIYVNPPKGSVDFTTPLCSDALRHVKVHTDYDMLLETSGVNTSVEGINIPVSFCFLNKDIYDEETAQYYDVDSLGRRTLKPGFNYEDPVIKALFNKSFGDALVGIRSINKSEKGHAFHNFNVPADYETIPKYHFNDSPDDQIFKEEKGTGERRIVFKEQLYQANDAEHQWIPGQNYYLLFAPYHVTEEHLQKHDIGTETFHIADECCILTEFSIMPPIEVKGDATVTSSDQVKACDNQIITFKVDMPALKLNEDETETTDAVIRGLNYDWWVGTSKADATIHGFLTSKYGKETDEKFITHYATDDVMLKDALDAFRFFYPYARSLDEAETKPYDEDLGYGLSAAQLACIQHFLTPLETPEQMGRKPLSLFGQTFNLKVSHAETDGHSMQHFVAIPIIPEQQYSVDEKLIYCPAPQELIIHVAATAPNINNGFASMPYPTHIENVPVRIGLGQAKAITKAATTASPGNTLNVPLRNITVTGSTSTRLIPTEYGTEPFGPIYLTATDDTTYTFAQEGDFKMRRVAQVIDIVAEKGAESGYMKVAFTTDFTMREGFTYTLKLPYIEDKACECEGTLVFDVKVVPEYQVWTGEHGSDWTNDKNWRRADRDILYAGNAASDGTQPLADYPSNEANKTDGSFVPMYFTNVMVDNAPNAVASLYNIIPASLSTRTFLAGLQATSTTGIIYDLETSRPDESGNYQCELFGTYVANGITFTPQSQLMNAHLLSYNKAWVEYLLDCDRWYTVSSPLQQTYSGEWYAPTKGYSQQTPHFYPITYNTILNNRFDPAFYQRSWDKAKADVYRMPGDGLLLTENPHNVAVKFDWSNVYNDVRVAYSNGGFSVKPVIGNSKATETSVLVRMPKDDNSYEYYNHAGSYHGDLTSIAHTEGQHHRLISDMLKDAETFSQTLTNNTADNRFFLVGNPFVASLNMDEFFRLNPHLQQKFWIMEADLQAVSVKTDDNNWHTTSSTATVAPGQGFFVVLKESAPATGSTEITFSRSMQAVTTTPLLQSAQNNITITATYEGRTESSAIITFSDAASREYVATEDAETLIDSNTSEEASTVFTLAGNNAVTVNATKADIQRIPLCLIAPEDKETTLTFTGAEGYYLYDNDEDASMPISSDTEVVVNGSSIGRYFITAKPIDDSMKDKLHEEEGDTYNLAGIRLASPRKGIVIRGGKKIYYE